MPAAVLRPSDQTFSRTLHAQAKSGHVDVASSNGVIVNDARDKTGDLHRVQAAMDGDFLDAATAAIRDGGAIARTCTSGIDAENQRHIAVVGNVFRARSQHQLDRDETIVE